MILYLENSYFKNPLSSAVMTSPLRPGKSNMLKTGGYNFTMEDVCIKIEYKLIYRSHPYNLYSVRDSFSMVRVGVLVLLSLVPGGRFP